MFDGGGHHGTKVWIIDNVNSMTSIIYKLEYGLVKLIFDSLCVRCDLFPFHNGKT